MKELKREHLEFPALKCYVLLETGLEGDLKLKDFV